MIATGKPCGAVTRPRSHPPLGSREAPRRQPRLPCQMTVPAFPALLLRVAPCPDGQSLPSGSLILHHSPTIEATAPRVQHEALPGAFGAWREPVIQSGLA